MRFPASGGSFIGKDQMADYLESYAQRFALPVRTGVRVERLDDEAKMLTVLRKTIPKMSPAALAIAGDASVPPRAAALLAKALAEPA